MEVVVVSSWFDKKFDDECTHQADKKAAHQMAAKKVKQLLMRSVLQ